MEIGEVGEAKSRPTCEQASGGGGSVRGAVGRLRHLLWLVIFLGCAAGIHNATASYFDGDTGYHVAVARLMARHGTLHAFPWTPFSWLADHYADKEYLFHVLLVPLAGLDPQLAARIAGSLLGALLLATLYALLVREHVPLPGLHALLPLAISSAFVQRFALVRAHLLSIPLALVIAWSATRRRWPWLGLACFLYPLCYTAWHLPLVLIGIVEGVRWLAVRRLEWRGFAVASAALACGIGLHPNFPANLELFWIQNVTVLVGTVLAGRPGFDMGGEFSPFGPLGLLRYVLLPAALALPAAWLGWRGRRQDALPLAMAAIAIAFLLATLRTQRFIEYLAPFAAFAFALAAARAGEAAPETARSRWRRALARGRAAPALVAIGLVWIALFARHPIERLRERGESFPPEVAARLQAIVPEGEQVVTCEWHGTGEMMLALPERRFMVALDPVFFAMHDEQKYRLWYQTVHDPPAEPARILRDAFQARFVICDRRMKWLPLMQALEGDAQARLRGIVGWWVVYELLPEAPPSVARTR